MNNDHRNSAQPPEDEIFNGLSQDPLADAGYGPVPHVPKPKKPEHMWRKLGIGVGVAVVVAALIVGGVALAKHKKPAKASSTSSTSATTNAHTTTPPATGSENTNVAAGTNAYTSNESTLKLALNYPSGWTPSPASTSPNGTDNITVTSPQATFTDANGASVTGKAVVSIRPASAGISEITNTPATAAQNSVQIGYTNPTASQHKYPFVTFLHFANGQKANGAFEEVMITGATSFSSGASVSMAALAGLDPVIAVNFYTCNGNTCNTPLSITNAEWTSNATAVEALNIFESLQLQ